MRSLIATMIFVGGFWSVAFADPDPILTFDALRAKAEQGDAAAQSSLGELYESGKAIPRDYPEALKWCRKAADQGNAKGQICLGGMYDLGRGVSQSSVEAVNWYRKAADQGYAEAQWSLGLAYKEGQGAPRDYRAYPVKTDTYYI